MDSEECNQKISLLTPLKELENFTKVIYEMKTDIYRNLERKFFDEITTIKFKIENSLKTDDILPILDKYATREELSNAEIDFDHFDFATKGRKLKKWVEKLIYEFDEDD